MQTRKITALVPIKDASERLQGKNFKVFAGQPLYQIVLDKLQRNDLVDQIVINTDSDRIKTDCAARYPKVKILERPPHIMGHHVTANTLIDYDLTQIVGEHFLNTHVTNPLISDQTITAAIEQYFAGLDRFDSLFSVYKVKKRGYDTQCIPINHSHDRLDQTQNLPEILVENSNLFLFSRTSFMNANRNRVGLKPQFFYMNELEGVDIDYETDFLMAELIHRNKTLFKDLN
jgi:CMP-N-acetylneuraminic acid synthetase